MARPPEIAARRPFMIEFVAPLPLAAVALMALNDRWLKAVLHNELTGKLSDIAICFFLPLYVAALLGVAVRGRASARLLVGAVVTALLFTLLEMSNGVGAAFTRAILWLGSPLGLCDPVLTRDPTDLLALLVIPTAVAYGLRRDCRLTLSQRAVEPK